MSHNLKNVLHINSQISARLQNIHALENKPQIFISIHELAAPVLRLRNPGFALASIMGKIDPQQVHLNFVITSCYENLN